MPVKTRVIKPAPNLEQPEEKKGKVLNSKELLGQYLNSKEVKPHHYNHYKDVDYTVSTGSLIFDIETGGGLHPSIMRFCGCSGAGKTSAALSICYNFLLPKKKRKAVYIKAEGRLGKNIRERSGIKFVDTPEEWEEGTCFIFKCNIYETIVELIEQLIKNNGEGISYYFIFDSMDALTVKADLGKSIDDATKVAGGTVISSMFLKRMSLPFSTFGHMAALMSQVRADVKINKYEKSDPRLTNANGGNALIHYSDWIFEFQKFRKDDLILDANAKLIGHWARIIFRKSPNEKEGQEIRYPILHNRMGAKSIWTEYEVAEVMISFEIAQKKGSWIELSDEIQKELEAGKLTFPPKMQGLDNLRGALTDSPEVSDFLYKKFSNTLKNEI